MVALLLFRDNPWSGCKGPEEAPEFAESSQFGTLMCHQFFDFDVFAISAVHFVQIL